MAIGKVHCRSRSKATSLLRDGYIGFFSKLYGFPRKAAVVDAIAGFSVNVFKKRHYILLVSRESDGTLNKVPVPLHYAYTFVAVAVIGLFTIAGLAGSYSRMLIKMSYFNQVRHDRDLAREN